MKRDPIDTITEAWDDARPDLDSEPVGIVLRVQALARLFAEQAASSLDGHALLWWEYDVLSALRRRPSPYTMSASELAEATSLTTGAMTWRMDGLEQQGLLQRKADPSDRRRVLVQLTASGLAAVEQAAGSRFAVAEQALSGLDALQRADLDRLLRQVLVSQED